MRNHEVPHWTLSLFIPLNPRSFPPRSLCVDSPSPWHIKQTCSEYNNFIYSKTKSIHGYSDMHSSIFVYIDIKFTYKISSKTSNTQTLSISDSFFASARRSSCCKSSEKKNAQPRHSLRSPWVCNTFSAWTSVKTGWMMIFHYISPTSKILKARLHVIIHPWWYTLDIIRYRLLRHQSRNKKKTSSCFCPPNLWVGNLRIFSLPKKTEPPKAIVRVEGPIESLLRGNNCHCFEWENTTRIFFTSSDSQHLDF